MPRTVDLRSCHWQPSSAVRTLRLATRLEIRVRALAHPAARQITCWVKLPAATPEIIEGINHGAVTEAGWTFAFQFPGRRRMRLMYHGSQEGRFRFPVPRRAASGGRIGIVIGIPGDNPGYVRLPVLRLEPASTATPPAPIPLSPQPGDTLTPAATDFYWQAAAASTTAAYQLEWRRIQGATASLRLPAYFESDAMRGSPPHRLRPGRYAWRVRAISLTGNPGPWPRWTDFRIQPPARWRPPDLAPSAAHPLFLIDFEAGDPRSAWRGFPPDIRPHLLLRVGGSIPAIEAMLTAAQADNIPIALQVNGPHDIIAGRWDRLPLARLLAWARKFPTLKAFYICEQAVQGGIRNREVRQYLLRLIALGAETGRPVIWADANWGRNVWLDASADRDFSLFLRRHRGYLFPLWKMNGGFEPYLAPAGLLGLWLSGTVSEWGVQPESWYWVEAGFRRLGWQGDYKQGLRTDAPAMIFQPLALLGASAGAAVYSFEPGSDLLAGGLGDAHARRHVFIPLARLLLAGTIPSKMDVRRALRWVHRIDARDLAFRKSYRRRLRTLFRQTLGIAYPFEEVPESGSCYWIPFVSPSAFRSWHTRPHRGCPPPQPGRAAIFRAGHTVFVLNSRLNWNEPQRFQIALGPFGLAGKLGVDGWLVARSLGTAQTDRGLRPRHTAAALWFSARRGAPVRLAFQPGIFWKAAGEPWSRRPVAHLDFVAGAAPREILIQQ